MIGEQDMGELARSELAAAQRDPRLGRGRGSMIADFRDAIDEADRVRMFNILGLHELSRALERKESELGVTRNQTGLTPDQEAELQAAWERAEMARTEINNDHAHENAQGLIAKNSALDAMVEEFVEAWIEMRVMMLCEEGLNNAEAELPEVAEKLGEEKLQFAKEKLAALLRAKLPQASKLRGSGASRYETPLAEVGLGAPEDRPIPDDLDRAITELGALRDVLIHRAGRVDNRALEQAPSLRYEEGELIRINRDEYRDYSSAIACYGWEIFFRSIRKWPDVTDQENGPDLDNWRAHHKLGI